MKKKIIITCSVLAVIIVCLACYFASKPDEDTVLAEYNGFKVTRGMVDSAKSAENLAAGEGNVKNDASTEDAIVDRLITGRMLVEEAEHRGIAATKAEMDENLEMLKNSYNDYPEIKKQVDDYCTGAGIGIDEYWTQVYEQSYDRISRTKLKSELGNDFCKETGYDGSVDDAMQTEEFEKYYDSYRAQLLKQHQSDVKYYS